MLCELIRNELFKLLKDKDFSGNVKFGVENNIIMQIAINTNSINCDIESIEKILNSVEKIATKSNYYGTVVFSIQNGKVIGGGYNYQFKGADLRRQLNDMR